MQSAVACLLVVASCLAPLGCARAEPPSVAAESTSAPAEAAQAATASAVRIVDNKRFGAVITEKRSTRLEDVAKEPARYAQKVIRTEGRVSAVCEHMGCWMEIADEAGTAHIKMAGHSFFVPKNSAGRHAVVQGKVLPREGDECTVEAEKQTGEIAKVQIEADGVEFID